MFSNISWFKMRVNILFVWLWHHCKRIYLPTIMSLRDKYNVQNLVWLDKRWYDGKALLTEYPDLVIETIWDEDFYQFMDKISKKYDINTIIISTDPLNHFQYIEWAIKHNINILTDKPLILEKDVISSVQSINNLFEKTEYLIELYKNSKTPMQCEIMCQRRFHKGYQLIRDKIVEIFNLTHSPITYINSFHSDWQRRFPDEIIDQNYHPYNQWYWKVWHSWYHTIDIVSWLINSTNSYTKNIDNIELFTQTSFPNDIIYQLNIDDYKNLFPWIKFKHNEKMYHNLLNWFWDVDDNISISFKHGNNTQSLASINLLHNWFWQRNWVNTEWKNLYKWNWRIRQEFLMIEQWPFQSIFMESFQSSELNKDNENLYINWGEHHFDIYIYRNTAMFPKLNRVEKFSISDLYTNLWSWYSRWHNEMARKEWINYFFENIVNNNVQTISNILNHELSLSIFNNIYKSINNRFNWLSPFIKFYV